jgi:hypothetical protein
MQTDFQIQASSRRCCVTGRELQTGEKFYSVLIEQAGKLVRQDYSLEAWKGPPEGTFSFWMARVNPPESKRRPPIDDEMLLDCFVRLEGQTDPGKVRFRYIVALLLLRRKRLDDRPGKRPASGEPEILVLRCVRTGEEYQVFDPCLTEQEMATVQDEVFQVLGWE